MSKKDDLKQKKKEIKRKMRNIGRNRKLKGKKKNKFKKLVLELQAVKKELRELDS